MLLVLSGAAAGSDGRIASFGNCDHRGRIAFDDTEYARAVAFADWAQPVYAASSIVVSLVTVFMGIRY